MIYKSNESRAKLAQAFLFSIIALYTIGIISSFFEYNLIKGLRMGTEVNINAANANDLRQRIIAILQVLGWIGSGTCFIMWFRRAYYNLNRKVNLKYTDGWAAIAWFVPLLNLWRPFYMFRELYFAANIIIKSKFLGQYKLLNPLYLWVWWAAWLINYLLGRISFQMNRYAETIEEFLSATRFDIISSGWCILTALLAIKVVRDFAAIEPLIYQDDTTHTSAFNPEELDN